MSQGNTAHPIVFVWENLGPMHVDRCVAVARSYNGRRKVIGLELGAISDTYEWHSSNSPEFDKITLFPGIRSSNVSILQRIFRLTSMCLGLKGSDYFLCHYEKPEVLLCAIILRLFRKRVFVMGDSKFDDKPRKILRELAKSLFFLPYNGALAAGTRSEKYFKFSGFRDSKILRGYDTLSLSRIRTLAEIESSANVPDFRERHFTVIARFVPKKNLLKMMDAYSLYVRNVKNPRSLHLCGAGILESELRKMVVENRLQDNVIFHGFVQSDDVAKILAKTLALLLVSVEEQFGLVVIEAQALGIPLIYTPNCGARDELLRTGVNGFLVEPNNCAGIAYFMELLDRDEVLWSRLSNAARKSSALGDVARFAAAVNQLSKSDK